MHEELLVACQAWKHSTAQIKNYIVKIQNQFGKKFSFVCYDGAREVATDSLKRFYKDEAIERQTTVICAH